MALHVSCILPYYASNCDPQSLSIASSPIHDLTPPASNLYRRCVSGAHKSAGDGRRETFPPSPLPLPSPAQSRTDHQAFVKPHEKPPPPPSSFTHQTPRP